MAVVEHINTVEPHEDKPWMKADMSKDSPHWGNLYVAWTLGGPSIDASVMITRSTDQGAHWSTPLRVDNGSDGVVWPATVTVANDGHVYVAYHSQTGFTAPDNVGENPDGVSGKRESELCDNARNARRAIMFID